MKQFILAATVLFSLSSFTAINESADVNFKAKNNFVANFTKAKDVQWKVQGSYNKATALVNNELVEVFYNRQGDLIGSTKSVDFDKLPKSAIQTITSKYTFPAYTLKECIEFADNNNDKKYYVSLHTAKDRLVLEISEEGEISVYSRK